MTAMKLVTCSAAPPIRVPDAPAIVAGIRDVVWLGPSGAIQTLEHSEAARRIHAGEQPIVCHAKAVARRLRTAPFPAYDVLELFAFVRPARFCLPTARGLAESLLLTTPETVDQEVHTLIAASGALLAELRASPQDDALAVASAMALARWPWAAAVLNAISGREAPPSEDVSGGLNVWNRLKEWEDQAPPGRPDSWPVEAVEARARLVQLLGPLSEPRPQQMQYSAHAAAAFQPRDRAGEPRVVLAEAGTGVGKTLGYVAPASVWAQKNKGPVWISTYTRNLQRQLDRELDRLYPDLREKTRKVVVRKGRENTFCLLNFSEAVARLPPRGGDMAGVALGLVARWAAATRDGDMVGGDFPGWLADLLGPGLTVDLTDTRGECIYGACRHYRKCFIERSIRRARRAEIVVANHALVMVQAAIGGDDQSLPARYVFDEGHHLFEAADSAFAAHLTGRETAELRRWLLGGEDRGRSRSRGLRERLQDLIGADEAAVHALDEALAAARALPSRGWRRRLSADSAIGATESFLALIRTQVYARSGDGEPGYSLECLLRPPIEGLIRAAQSLEAALQRLVNPLVAVAQALARRLDAEAAELDPALRHRLEAIGRSLERRAIAPLSAWRMMLRALETQTPPAFVDWLGIERYDGMEIDVGLYRHWRDPMQPFVETIGETAHGMLITSATLRDGTGNEEADWSAAENRLGVRYLRSPPVMSALPSPFDYPRQTRVFVVTDVGRNDPAEVAAAYRELFLAAGGGALGLFTAVQRLRAVWERIAVPLDEAGLRLFAQHVDGLDTGTLIDIFRADEDACLLGTDAVRDGVDVPGPSLRIIVYDRVPWPRPDILHRARREIFGGRSYDELLTRLKIKQAYGRLIRRVDDRGVFVMLDRAMPSRLASALPPGVAVSRVGLSEAVAAARAFLSRRTEPQEN
jgi:ATP-dependent DNA helicase DinG